MNFAIPTRLKKIHQKSNFDCGISELNSFLKKYALQNQKKDSSRTYIVLNDTQEIAAYYSLAFGSVAPFSAPQNINSGLGQYPIPVLILARLAVDIHYQGKGFGKALLKDALLRCVQASEIAGLKAFLVEAKNEKAEAFYQSFGFIPSPTKPSQLFLSVKNIKQNL